jgi:hypothetical protein
MRTNKTLKIILLFILTINCKIVMSQVKFVRYQDFEMTYSNNPDLNKLSKNYNLLFILFLDSSYEQQILEYDPGLENLYRGSAYGINFNESTVGFVTHVSNITEIFNSNLYVDKIFNCIYDEIPVKHYKKVISYPVYIKNNIAVLNVLTNSGNDTYYFKLYNGILQINWLGGTTE